MAESLHVRSLDDDPVAELRRRAARLGRSAEASADFDELAAELRNLTARRRQTPSEVLLRDGRDER
jgi:plasmid stability protein